MRELTFVSLLAGNADSLYRLLMAQLAARSGYPIRVLAPDSWAQREALLLGGQVDIAAVCGAVYTRLRERPAAPRLLAAPVMRAARYNGQPVYFSDVIVRADAPFRSFDDLAGARWAFNEEASFSGYALVGAQLAGVGRSARFFGQQRRAGSHQRAIDAVLAGEADTAAIDSIVLERAVALAPHLAAQLRTVAALGPNPVPPLVAAPQLAPAAYDALQRAILALHQHPGGRHALEQAQIARFVAVTDRDYDQIRTHLEASRSAWVARSF